MQTVSTTLLFAYLALIALICIYGAHRYWMVLSLLRVLRRAKPAAAPRLLERLPTVTVQLPMFNERHVARRVIEAACRIEYPRELLEIQVLDDSTDDSADIARQACEAMRGHGHNVVYRHRTNREGFKAGALAEGMRDCRGEFIAIFDADFVPPASFLNDLIHEFGSPDVGMVQARWSHLNADDSLLTQVQAIYIDGHFVVEQQARHGTGRWFNFNGTAGIWRKQCIIDAGGWHHDTLTEDTDLSYRAQLRGWHFRYRNDVCCPAELPPTVAAFLNQQHRWNKGLMQAAIKLLPDIMRSKATPQCKLEAAFHLTTPIMNLLVLLMVVLMTPLVLIQPRYDMLPSWAPTAVAVAFPMLGLGAASSFYLVSQRLQRRSFLHTLARLPALMACGVGISVMNSKGVLEALFRRQSPFVRTPKYNGAAETDLDPVLKAAKRRRRLRAGLIEVTLGCGMLLCCASLLLQPHTMLGAPFVLMFAAGFLAIGVPSLRGAKVRMPLQPAP